MMRLFLIHFVDQVSSGLASQLRYFMQLDRRRGIEIIKTSSSADPPTDLPLRYSIHEGESP